MFYCCFVQHCWHGIGRFPSHLLSTVPTSTISGAECAQMTHFSCFSLLVSRAAVGDSCAMNAAAVNRRISSRFAPRQPRRSCNFELSIRGVSDALSFLRPRRRLTHKKMHRSVQRAASVYFHELHDPQRGSRSSHSGPRRGARGSILPCSDWRLWRKRQANLQSDEASLL